MDLVRACGDGCQRIGDGQATVAMAVPVNTNVFTAGFHHVGDHEFHQIVGAFGRGVTNGVAENDGTCPATNRRFVEALDGDGSVRMVSSVTYMEGRLWSTANFTAFSVVRSR